MRYYVFQDDVFAISLENKKAVEAYITEHQFNNATGGEQPTKWLVVYGKELELNFTATLDNPRQRPEKVAPLPVSEK